VAVEQELDERRPRDADASLTDAGRCTTGIALSMSRFVPEAVSLHFAATTSTESFGGRLVTLRTRVSATLHYSVQSDHVHVLVESDAVSISRRIQGLAIRLAKAVNRILGRRGRVWGDRYHSRLLRTPREVRHALVYVLQNWRKHLRGVRGLDPRSSALWFTGWRSRSGIPAAPSPVRAPRTWLAAIGWRRHGLIDVDETPASRRRGP
jgi:hypothetical protein